MAAASGSGSELISEMTIRNNVRKKSGENNGGKTAKATGNGENGVKISQRGALTGAETASSAAKAICFWPSGAVSGGW